MASVKDTASFFAHGNSKQFEYVIKLYPIVLKLKAEKRTKKPEELIKLDDWYQNELPKRIKQRGKDAHVVHEELVQTMKWKQSRGKFYPQLSYLVKVNTPRAVIAETKKAFKKLPNLEQAITALSNLKGVGTTMASALLAAAAPESAPFMADECLMAIPEIEGIDYTTKEYLNFVTHIQTTLARLNSEKDNPASWSAHRVELALWTHYIASELKPELLEGMPDNLCNNTTTETTTEIVTTTTAGLEDTDDSEITTTTAIPTAQTTIVAAAAPVSTNGTSPALLDPSDESNLEPAVAAPNGVIDSLDESTRSEDSSEKPITPIFTANEETTNDSDSQSSAKRSLDCENSEDQTETTSEPEIKKIKSD